MKKRLDQIVVDQGLAPSKTKAQELIERGLVQVCKQHQWQVCFKPGRLFSPPLPAIKILDQKLLQYVSRGGLKLEAALNEIHLNPSGSVALDVGISTGGFADCLLQMGAKTVVGVDVAKDELAQRLKTEPRLLFYSGINARELSKKWPSKIKIFDLITVDVSFISLDKILPELTPFLAPRGILLALVKPQFEVGSKLLDKRGVVKSQEAILKVEKKIIACAEGVGFKVNRYFPCAVKGRDGNQEYFLYATKSE